MNEQENTRRDIANQIRLMRHNERFGNVYTERNGEDYERIFRGLSESFDYASYLGTKVVLDIGAGNLSGVSDLSENYPWLDFRATVLTLPVGYSPTNDIYRTTVTSAETLRGVENNSVSCALALNSIAYSKAPEAVINRLDEVLAPAGILKATFRSWRRDGQYLEDLYDAAGFSYHDEFAKAFEQKGYDLYLWHGPFDILTAVKPPIKVSAKDLALGDLEVYNAGIGRDLNNVRSALGGNSLKRASTP